MGILLAALLGAMIGSFLNVCIVRLPVGQSIVAPRSHCRTCLTPLLNRDNIPILGFILLRGRCRACHARFSARYPLVEALTASLFVVVFARFGPTPEFAVAALFTSALIAVTFIDLDHQIIPDVISLPGIVLGLLFSLVGLGPTIVDSLAGLLLGGGLLYAVAVGYHHLAGREGMGGGDIKLMAMIGAFLGWQAVFLVLLIGSFTGSIIGAALMAAQGGDTKSAIPFGPFLSAGALIALLWGNDIAVWYLDFAGI